MSKPVSRVLSWTAICLMRAVTVRARSDLPKRDGQPLALAWSCSGRGLQSLPRRRGSGGLLPHLSILTVVNGGLFLLHFPWSRLRRALPGALALRSPDFPRYRAAVRFTRGICYSVVSSLELLSAASAAFSSASCFSLSSCPSFLSCSIFSS